MPFRRSLASAALASVCACAAAPEIVVVCDDAGWCWFQDERALALDGRVVVGSVAAGQRDPQRRGDVQLSVWELASGAVRTLELHDQLELDDHAAPALLRLSDGRVLAVYAKHGADDLVRWRRSSDASLAQWEPERSVDAVDDGRLGATYSNLFALADGALLDVHRGDGWDPCVLRSDDLGSSWSRLGKLLAGPGRPYVKFATDGRRLHFVCTEQHPRDFDNGLYHGVLDGTRVLDSRGTPLGELGRRAPKPEQLTRVFAGAPDAVAWPCDLELDGAGQPCAVFSVQRDGAGVPRGLGGMDHRFFYARFDRGAWAARELAFAGSRLYAGEDDYTGLAALDPDDVRVVYLSTDADPRDGRPLISAADGRRHRELFRATTMDSGATWRFEALTRDSRADNLRPVVPARHGGRSALLWLRGELRSYTDYSLAIMGMSLEKKP